MLCCRCYSLEETVSVVLLLSGRDRVVLLLSGRDRVVLLLSGRDRVAVYILYRSVLNNGRV